VYGFGFLLKNGFSFLYSDCQFVFHGRLFYGKGKAFSAENRQYSFFNPIFSAIIRKIHDIFKARVGSAGMSRNDVSRRGGFVPSPETVHANHNLRIMSWILILGFALSVFFLLMFFLSRFVNHMKKEQNLQIESLKETLIDKDNPVGLTGDELEKMKQQQAEAQAHLREVISKIPVIQKDGKFQVDMDAVRKQKEQAAATNGSAVGPQSGKNA